MSMQFSYNQGEAENLYSQKEFVELFRGKTKEKVVDELIRNGSRERDAQLLVDRMVFYSEYFKKTADGRKQLSYMFKEKAKDYGHTVLSGFGFVVGSAVVFLILNALSTYFAGFLIISRFLIITFASGCIMIIAGLGGLFINLIRSGIRK